jgi:hypothetical protein
MAEECKNLFFCHAFSSHAHQVTSRNNHRIRHTFLMWNQSHSPCSSLERKSQSMVGAAAISHRVRFDDCGHQQHYHPPVECSVCNHFSIKAVVIINKHSSEE